MDANKKVDVNEAFVTEWQKQGFTQTVLRFLFRSVFFHFEIIAMTIAAAASSLLIVLSVEIEIKELK